MITELNSIVSNCSTLRHLIMDLQYAGYVTTKEVIQDKCKIAVLLTEKGGAVAEHQKRAEGVANGEDVKSKQHSRCLLNGVIGSKDCLP